VYFRSDCAVKSPQCSVIDGVEQDCGSWFATYYYNIFLVIVSFVVLEMMVAVVLEHFTWMYAMNKTLQNQDKLKVTYGDLQVFNTVWKEFDPRSVGRISLAQLGPLLHRLDAKQCGLTSFLHVASSEAASPGGVSPGVVHASSGVAQVRIKDCLKAMPRYKKYPGEVQFRDIFSVLVAESLGYRAIMSREVLQRLTEAKQKFNVLKAGVKCLSTMNLKTRSNFNKILSTTFAAPGIEENSSSSSLSPASPIVAEPDQKPPRERPGDGSQGDALRCESVNSNEEAG